MHRSQKRMNKKRGNKQIVIYTENSKQTFKLGETLGDVLYEGDCIALFGTLGSGKTLLTQGIARGLNVPENVYVTSPTFTLINEYPGRIPIYHVDLYRISNEDELIELGLDELMLERGVVVVEWAEKLPDRYLKSCNVRIRLEIEDAEERKITVESNRDTVVEAVAKCFNRKAK